ncbi:MAG: hypothetical protein ABI950_06810 [Solirubrobacteraceae bacterium]
MSTERNTTHSRRTAALAAALTAAAATTAVLLSSAAAQDPGGRTLTLHELEKGATFTHVRNTRGARRQSSLQGDLFAFTNPLADAAGARVGTLHVHCVATVGAQNFRRSTLTCSGILHLRDGDLMLQADTRPSAATTAGAVTGGTGAYANARGVFVSKSGRSGSTDTITLAG